ncbi:hypothetical protein SAMN05421827_10283 [Pedobacter terrae]|uniref:Uncharacterized protein n=1 Tax=Pedobacter terrae TaxID=405671 RepID=A0A1G7PXN8_9SPHI|nr:hypothetical protein SAMN05421827_10283 [Pedobacter terrae]
MHLFLLNFKTKPKYDTTITNNLIVSNHVQYSIAGLQEEAYR